MTFDVYLDGLLLAQNLQLATVSDLCKLAAHDIEWAVAECGQCNIIDDSNRTVALVHHGDDPNQGQN